MIVDFMIKNKDQVLYLEKSPKNSPKGERPINFPHAFEKYPKFRGKSLMLTTLIVESAGLSDGGLTGVYCIQSYNALWNKDVLILFFKQLDLDFRAYNGLEPIDLFCPLDELSKFSCTYSSLFQVIQHTKKKWKNDQAAAPK